MAEPTRRRSRRHDHDAGGPSDVLAAKAAVRDEVWSAMAEPGIRRFPSPRNRIPNFVGAEAAADRLRGSDAWVAATTLKANPDSPQWPVRERALADGKLVFMAVPRLADERPFFLLDPSRLTGSPRAASSIKGASASALTVALDELEPVDLVVAGCVAVDEAGARLGKGGGFSDLELALASEVGLIGPRTLVATTVHERQVVERGVIPTVDHDVPLDLILTPERVIVTGARRRPLGIRWDELTPDKIAAIPVLRQRAPTV